MWSYEYVEKNMQDRYILTGKVKFDDHIDWHYTDREMREFYKYLTERSAFVFTYRLTGEDGEFLIIFAPGYCEFDHLYNELCDIFSKDCEFKIEKVKKIYDIKDEDS